MTFVSCTPDQVRTNGFIHRFTRLMERIKGRWIGWNSFDEGGGIHALAKEVKSLMFSQGGQWSIEAQVSSTFPADVRVAFAFADNPHAGLIYRLLHEQLARSVHGL